MDINISRKLARDETTAPEVLARLAKTKDRITRKNVASNPNTSLEILLELGAEFPREFLKNPVFDLLFLEKTNFAKEIPYQTFSRLVCEEGITPAFLELATEHLDERVQLLIARDPATPTSGLKKLLENSFNQNNQSIFGSTCKQIAFNPNASEEILELLSKKSEDIKWARYLVQCPNIKISTKVLERLIENTGKKTLCYIASHPYTPENIVEKLFLRHAKNIEIIRAITSNSNTSSHILELIGEYSSDRSTLINIAEHPNTPSNILKKLANNPHPSIIRSLAVRSDISERILLKIAIRVVNSLFTKFSSLKKKELVFQGINDLQRAKNNSTSNSLLEKFTEHRWNLVRLAVAKNLNASDIVLKKLATDREFVIAEWVAKHPNTSTETLNILRKCPASYVVRIALEHPNISRVTKQRYYSSVRHKYF